ncbi:MAG: fibronectin type III domain-containing protein [Terracidiphilus sp.]|jgi:hypothetical protein
MQSAIEWNAPRRTAIRFAALAATLAAVLAVAGCGMPSAPLPPSLHLAVPVTDLSAVRSGGQAALTWTMPTKTTDKVLLQGNIEVRVCRNEMASAACSAAATLQLAPGSGATFTDTLPSALAAGPPRAITYFVELDNRKGRSAGPSNKVKVLAGEAPPAVENLTAEMSKNGVLLRWTPVAPGSSPAAIRLVRRLLTPPAKKSGESSLAQPAELLVQTLLVEPAALSDRALDTAIRFGGTYEYRAQRVARVTVNGETLELASPLSLPLRIEAAKLFPPNPPQGLVAVSTAGENGAGPAIDLSWLPASESDLAGYIVYRREVGASGAVPWQRISPAQPVAGPAYRDFGVQPGHTYVYAVSAIDQEGNESARSAEAQETVPEP